MGCYMHIIGMYIFVLVYCIFLRKFVANTKLLGVISVRYWCIRISDIPYIFIQVMFE